jgi:hypothetical protein
MDLDLPSSCIAAGYITKQNGVKSCFVCNCSETDLPWYQHTYLLHVTLQVYQELAGNVHSSVQSYKTVALFPAGATRQTGTGSRTADSVLADCILTYASPICAVCEGRGTRVHAQLVPSGREACTAAFHCRAAAVAAAAARSLCLL